MANEFQNGTDWGLFVDTTTPTTTALTAVTYDNFVLVACLTNNGFAGTTDTIDASTKCSGRWLESVAGGQSWTMSAEGNTIKTEVGDERANHKVLRNIWKSTNPAWFAIMPIIEEAEPDYIDYGVGRIDSYDFTAPRAAPNTFSISITGIGEPGDETTLDITP